MKRRDFITQSIGTTVLAAAPTLSALYLRVNDKIEKSSNDNVTYDVIVLGVGSMGSATCYHLAKQGHKVLGLEQFDIPHELGSHAGQSRLIRKAYAEHPDYVPLLERAYQNWKTLETESGIQVYFKTGLLYFGESSNSFLKGVLTSSEKYNIQVNSLSKSVVTKKYPQFNIPNDFKCLEEPDAGFVTPERCILLFTEQAVQLGAVIRTKEKVSEWKRENGLIKVKTNKGTFTSKKLVITAGPWTIKMIPGYASKLKVTRQMVAWMKPKKWDLFTMDNFPCWDIEDGDYSYYGFPILPVGKFGAPLGLKLAMHYPGGDISDPDTVNRIPNEQDEKVLINALNKFIPEGYSETLVMKTCMYTNSPDENFILDYLDGYDKDVAIATGFSGHGFKFASVIGEIMADLAMKGSTALPIGFLNASRFK